MEATTTTRTADNQRAGCDVPQPGTWVEHWTNGESVTYQRQPSGLWTSSVLNARSFRTMTLARIATTATMVGEAS